MTSDKTSSDIAAEVDTCIQALVALDRFSGSVLIAREGEVLASAGYGLANREHGVPNTPQTKFRLGSLTKQFTAMSILMLRDQGKLQLQDPISDLLPDCPDVWNTVTIHHLLNHTSGIPEHTDRLDWKTTGRTPLQVQEIADLFRRQPLDFRPGARHQYSNSGYILLGQVIEQVSGVSYEAFVQERIFMPLGMADTGYDRSDRVLENRAAGYDLRDDVYVNADFLDMSIPHAAGALYSTVEDLLLWDQSLYSEQLVPRASLEAMWSISPFLANYGYGVGAGSQFGRRLIGHGGGIHGFVTHLVRYPDDKLCLVVLCNLASSDPFEVSHMLAAITFGEEYTVPQVRVPAQLETGVYAALEGDYQLAPGIVISIRAGEQRLVAEGNHGGRAEFFPESENRFYRKASDDQLSFARDQTGKVGHLLLQQKDVEQRADRIG